MYSKEEHNKEDDEAESPKEKEQEEQEEPTIMGERLIQFQKGGQGGCERKRGRTYM